MVIIGIYVNDCLIIGKEESIECLIDDLKKHESNLKIKRSLNEYFSCCIEEYTYHDSAALVDFLFQNFGEEIEVKRKFLTPGTPRFKIQRSTVNLDVLVTQSQRKY
jgi:hypothetical protein